MVFIKNILNAIQPFKHINLHIKVSLQCKKLIVSINKN